MGEETAAEIRARLDRGEWLRPGQLAVLFGTTRTSIDRWIRKGVFTYRETPSGRRECNPDDVRRELAKYLEVRQHGDSPPAGG